MLPGRSAVYSLGWQGALNRARPTSLCRTSSAVTTAFLLTEGAYGVAVGVGIYIAAMCLLIALVRGTGLETLETLDGF